MPAESIRSPDKMGSRRGLSSIFGSRTESEASSVAGKELMSVPDGAAASSPPLSPPRMRDLAPAFSTVEDSPMFRNKVWCTGEDGALRWLACFTADRGATRSTCHAFGASGCLSQCGLGS